LSRGRAQRIRPPSRRTQATVSITTGTLPAGAVETEIFHRLADASRP